MSTYSSKTRHREKDLVVFLAKQILLHHPSAYRMIKILVLLECCEGDRAIDLLEIAVPKEQEKMLSQYQEQNLRLTRGHLTKVAQTSSVQRGPASRLSAQ